MSRNYRDWLSAFVQHASIGEAPLSVLYWVGVSTIAGALRRRVWIDEVNFQWVPNFYIVVVADPGIIAKSTTANIGFNLLRKVEGINFGPDIITWESLIEEMGKTGEFFEYQGVQLPMTATTCAVDELGNFIDPENDKQISALIALWDGKAGAFKKYTKTQGKDTLANPWLNVFGCTTPNWLGRNFPESFIDGGLFSRMIWLRAHDKRQLVPHISRVVPPGYGIERMKLIADLQQMAKLAGPFRYTEAAYEYSDRRYREHWGRFAVNSREWMGYPARWQSHLFKLAMVISVARDHFPVVDVEHVREADAQLAAIEPGIKSVFEAIGSKEVPKAAAELVDVLRKIGGRGLRRSIYGTHFFRRLSNKEFTEATEAAVAAGLVGVTQQTPVELFLLEGTKK